MRYSPTPVRIKIPRTGQIVSLAGQLASLLRLMIDERSGITWSEILARTGIVNYKGRIHDLRRRGIAIKTKGKSLAEGRPVALYRLADEVEVIENEEA